MLDDSDKKKVKALFSEFMDCVDRRKEISDTVKDLRKETAAIFEVKEPVVSKLWHIMQQKWEDGYDELEDLNSLMAELEE